MRERECVRDCRAREIERVGEGEREREAADLEDT